MLSSNGLTGFKTKEELLQAIEEYMTYYTTKRVQRNLVKGKSNVHR